MNQDNLMYVDYNTGDYYYLRSLPFRELKQVAEYMQIGLSGTRSFYVNEILMRNFNREEYEKYKKTLESLNEMNIG
jgi:NRPS condensation-like uncharacterized protein